MARVRPPRPPPAMSTLGLPSGSPGDDIGIEGGRVGSETPWVSVVDISGADIFFEGERGM